MFKKFKNHGCPLNPTLIFDNDDDDDDDDNYADGGGFFYFELI